MNRTAAGRLPDLSFTPGVDDPTTHFTEVYEIYQRIILAAVRRELRAADQNVAEDLAAEVFMCYWRRITVAGRQVQNAGGFLRRMVVNHVTAYYRVKRNTMTRACDLNDPKYTPVLAQSTAPCAVTMSEQTYLNVELGEALEAMTRASTRWKKASRAKTAVTNGCRGSVAYGRSGDTPEWQAKVADRTEAEAYALDEFRTRCERVGQIRAALNATRTVFA